MIFKGLFFIYRLTLGKIIVKIIRGVKARAEKKKAAALNTDKTDGAVSSEGEFINGN